MSSSLEFLVPISISVTSPQVASSAAGNQQQQPSINEQPLVESVSWALVDGAKRRTEWTRTSCLAGRNVVGRSQDSANATALNDAISQISESLAGKKFTLVSCGPIPLRQHLHPIARRLKVALGEHFDRYIDLLREFDRSLKTRPNDQNQQAADQIAAPEQVASGATLTSSKPTASLDEKSPVQVAAVAPQQQQQISAGSRKRLEDILKHLNIDLDSFADRLGGCDAGTNCAGSMAAAVSAEANAQTAASEKQKQLAIGKNAVDCPKILQGERLLVASCAIIERLLAGGHQIASVELIKRRVEVGICDVSTQEAEQRVVRARGLPWQATEQDIADFFVGLNITKGGVALCLSRQGRRNGEALVQFESKEHRNLALNRHKHFMGDRYIEVYRASADDFMSVAAGYNNKAEKFLSRGAQAIIRMRGLPFTCSARQVVDFFASSAGISTYQNHGGGGSIQQAAASKQRPCEVLAGEDGVLFVKNSDEKPTGDAFVLFASDEQAKRALARHHQNIGSRYVELFRSTVSEVQQVLSISTIGQQQHQNNDELKATSQKSASAAGNRESKQTKTQTTVNSNQQQQQPRLVISNKNAAFPALMSKPVAWCRSETITYAQVAHSKESTTIVAGCKAAKVVNKTSDQSEQSTNKEVEKKNVDKRATKQLNLAALTLSPAIGNVQDPEAAALANDNVSTTPASSSEPKMSQQTPVEMKLDESVATTQPAEESDSQQQEVSSVNSASSTPQAHSPNSSMCSSSVGHNSASSSYSWRQTGSNQQQTNAGGNQNSRRHNNSNNYQQHANRQNSRYQQNNNNPTAQHNHYSAIQHQQSLAYAAAGYAMGLPLDASQHHAMALAQSQPLPLAPAVSHYSNQHHNPYAYDPNQAHSSQQVVAGGAQSGPLSPVDSLSHHAHAAAYYPIATSAAAAHYIAAAAAAAAAAALHQQQVPNSSNATAPISSGNSNRSGTSTGLQTSSPQSGTSKTTATSEHQVALAAAPTSNPYDPQLITSQRDCIRLRGLPFEAQIEDVISFLGRHSEFVLYQGVHMVYTPQGQPTGEAIIQMSSCEAAAAVAQDSHRRVMSVGKKQRYIEVIPSSIDDLKPTLGYGLASFAAGRAAAAAAAAYNQLPAAGMHHHYPATTTAGDYLAPNMTDQHQNQLHHLPAMIYDDKMTAMMRESSQVGECVASNVASPCCSASAEASATETPSAGGTAMDNDCKRDQSEMCRDAIGSPSTDSCASSSGCATSSSVGQTSDEQQTLTTEKPNFDGANPEQLDHSHNQLQLQQLQQQQQQQALMAATAAAQAAAAAYYPIFYYYPPQQMLATAPTANTSPYH